MSNMDKSVVLNRVFFYKNPLDVTLIQLHYAVIVFLMIY